jgi:hypothetical protein
MGAWCRKQAHLLMTLFKVITAVFKVFGVGLVLVVASGCGSGGLCVCVCVWRC